MNRFLALLFTVAVAAAGSVPLKPRAHPPGQSRVVNGDPAEEGQFPFQISFQRSDFTGGHFCGGSILTPNHVIIAAHCVDDLNLGSTDAWVIAGSLTWNGGDETAQRGDVEDVAVYGNWNPSTLNYDYAVLTLAGDGLDVEAENVATIRIPPPELGDPLGLDCTASGWGADENGNPPAELQWTTAYGISDDECRSFNSGSVDECTSCTLDPNGQTGICFGDSGGPLVCEVEGERWLFGIASWGYGSGASCSTTLPNGWGQTTYADAQDFIDDACGGCITAA